MSENHPDIVFAKVNTEEERELAGHFQIRSIPTLMVFRQQIIVFSQPGALPPAGLASVIEKVGELDMDEVRRQVAEQSETGQDKA
jgi:thioredoxin 1